MTIPENQIIENTIQDLYQIPDFQMGGVSLAQAIEYLPGFGEDQNWFIVKSLMIALSIVLATLFIIIISKTNKLIGSKTNSIKKIPSEPASSILNTRWKEIERHISSTREAEWKFAVIEADKLTDEMLQTSGFAGETMGERLMNIQPGQLITLQGLWEAHKIRNRLVHDVNYFLRYTEAKRAVGLYEETLKELQAL